MQISTCDIFHSLCQAVNKALRWKWSLFNNKIFKSYTVLLVFQVKSSWILPVSTVLLWDTQTLSQQSFSFRDIPHDKQTPLPEARHRAGMRREWSCAFVNVFFWHAKTLPFCIRTKESVLPAKYWNEIFEVFPHPRVAIAEAQRQYRKPSTPS